MPFALISMQYLRFISAKNYASIIDIRLMLAHVILPYIGIFKVKINSFAVFTDLLCENACSIIIIINDD